MLYGTANDPTFDHIHYKTHAMTINKFMIFCREFGVFQLAGASRKLLTEIFKKNS